VLVLLFLVAVIVIYISEKKKEKQNFCLRRYCSLAAAILFKTECFVELGLDLLFSNGKRRSEQV
jgi:hypothetical protein